MMRKTLLYILFISIVSTQLLKAQCYPDRHSTNWYDGWVSCETSSNPISSYGETHWIMYDLGYDYVLNETKLWNANEPKNLDYGISSFNIDYSLDKNTWISLGEFNMEQGTGFSNYEGVEGPDFNEVKARYVLITPTSNYGGNCYGLSELKINITDPFEVTFEEDGFNAMAYPNPFVNSISIRVLSTNDSYPVSYALYDMLGRLISNSSFNLNEGVDNYQLPVNGKTLSIGIYILKIQQGSKEKSFKLIKRE